MPTEIFDAVNKFLIQYGWPIAKEKMHRFEIADRIIEHACYYARPTGMELQFLTSSPGNYSNYMVMIRLIRLRLRTSRAIRVELVDGAFKVLNEQDQFLLHFDNFSNKDWVAKHVGDWLIEDRSGRRK